MGVPLRINRFNILAHLLWFFPLFNKAEGHAIPPSSAPILKLLGVIPRETLYFPYI